MYEEGMERSLDRYLTDAQGHHSVAGVVCADANGLLIQNTGKAPKEAASTIKQLIDLAVKIEPGARESPVVVIEGDAMNILIKTVDKVTTAVYKSNESK